MIGNSQSRFTKLFVTGISPFCSRLIAEITFNRWKNVMVDWAGLAEKESLDPDARGEGPRRKESAIFSLKVGDIFYLWPVH